MVGVRFGTALERLESLGGMVTAIITPTLLNIAMVILTISTIRFIIGLHNRRWSVGAGRYPRRHKLKFEVEQPQFGRDISHSYRRRMFRIPHRSQKREPDQFLH